MLRMKTVSLDMFFDRREVVRAADAANRKNLSKAGAFVRTAARHSIRRRKGASPPERPARPAGDSSGRGFRRKPTS